VGTVWWAGVYRADDMRERIDVQILEPLVFAVSMTLKLKLMNKLDPGKIEPRIFF
jgi:hypothetical protein